MPLLCAAALVQSMRREAVWHVSEGIYVSQTSCPARVRFVTFSIDETNGKFHRHQTLRARSNSPSADQDLKDPPRHEPFACLSLATTRY